MITVQRAVATSAAVWLSLLSGCGSSNQESTTDSPTRVTVVASPAMVPVVTISCSPVPRFRLGGIEYEVQTFDDVLELGDVGEVYAENLVLPRAIIECEPFVVLNDGEGSLPAGTTVYSIVGEDPSEALTASMGNDRYLRFKAHA